MSSDSGKSFDYAQIWWLLICLTLLAAYVAFDRNYLADALEADRSYISILILVTFAGASAHAAWHVVVVSRKIESAYAMLDGDPVENDGRSGPNFTGFEHPGRFIAHYVGSLCRHRETANADIAAREGALILDVYADRLRNPSETGWYLVDILIRMGLVGTIIGFIIVLSALSDGPAPTGDNIQSLLIAMSGGMGTALYTTLAGLICASLLGAQYMILGRATEHLISLLIDLKSRVLAEDLST